MKGAGADLSRVQAAVPDDEDREQPLAAARTDVASPADFRIQPVSSRSMSRARPLAALLRMRLHSIRNAVFNVRKDSAAKATVVVFGLCNVVALGFWGSYRSFEFIEGFKAFGDLNSKMVSLLFFALLVLVIFSTVIITYTTVFSSKETAFLFQSPSPPKTTLAVKLLESISFSAWASLFLGLPVLVAFGIQQAAPWTYYWELAAVLPLFLLLAGLIGACVSFLLAPLLRRLSARTLVIASILLLVLLTWVFLRSFDLSALQGDNNLLVLDRFTRGLQAAQSPFSPSRWASTAVLSARDGNHGEVLFQSLTMLANTLIFFPLIGLYGRKVYLAEWLARQSSQQGSRRRQTESLLSRIAFRGGAGSALVSKDVLVFLRNPAQLSQSLLFLLLMLIYSLSLLQIPDFFVENSRLRHFIYFANLAAICMILSSFTSRFLFPLISLEGRSFWVLGLAPMHRTRILRQKVLFGLFVSLSLGLATIILSNLSLRTSLEMSVAAVYTMVLAAVCLASLATGLGAAYPSFDEDNPARIAVGMGGTLNFFASALTVATLITIEALPYILQTTSSWTEEHFDHLVLASHVSALVFAVLLSYTVLRLGGRALTRREF